MRYAFSTLGCPSWTPEHTAEQAAKLGYEGVELRLVGDDVIGPNYPVADARRLRTIYDDAGIAVCCLDTSCAFATGDPVQLDWARRYIELGLELGTTLLRVFGGNTDLDEDAAVANVATALETLEPEAASAGMTLALETHDKFSSGRLSGAVLDRVPSEHVAVVWDTQHPYRTGETPQETWDALSGRVAHTHLKDATSDGQLTLLGEGHVPIADAVDIWKRSGYDGWVSFEWEKKWHPTIPEPEIAFPHAIEFMRKVLG